MAKTSILFVCMGNICRSPAAEGVFRHLVDSKGIADQFHIDSAGTLGYHEGELPDKRMRAAASQRGISLEGQRARPFRTADFEAFDMILVMDEPNLRDIRSLDRAGKYHDKVRLMLDFNPDKSETEVPDPYYGGSDGFDHVLDLLEGASGPLLDHILKS